MICGVYTTVIYRSLHDGFPLTSMDVGTYMRLDLLLGSAKGCPGSTCISLCGWKGVTLSVAHAYFLKCLARWQGCRLSKNRLEQELRENSCHAIRLIA